MSCAKASAARRRVGPSQSSARSSSFRALRRAFGSNLLSAPSPTLVRVCASSAATRRAASARHASTRPMKATGSASSASSRVESAYACVWKWWSANHCSSSTWRSSAAACSFGRSAIAAARARCAVSTAAGFGTIADVREPSITRYWRKPLKKRSTGWTTNEKKKYDSASARVRQRDVHRPFLSFAYTRHDGGRSAHQSCQFAANASAMNEESDDDAALRTTT